MILWKFTLREVRNRPGRATLTVLSIVIGVAAVVAVTVGTATTHQAYQEMYESVAGRAALEVASESGGFFAEDLAQRIKQVPGVKAAVPTIQRFSALWHGKNHLQMLVMGIDPTHDEAVRDYDLKEGAFFHEKYDALLETGFARGLGVSVGDEVKLIVSRGGLHGSVKKFKITGLLSPRGAAGFNQGGVIFLPLKTAGTLFSKPGNINSISVVLAETADERGVAAEIAKLLPTGLAVRSPMARSQLAKETVQDAEKGLNFAYALMIVLAIFTIFNTFLMNVGERRRQLAVLRAIGATRRQIMRMLLLEGLAMGLLGTVLGSLVGLGGAYGLTQAMGQVYGTTMPALRITPGPFIVAAFLGPGISLLAMFIPARIAGKISPLEGMRFIASEARRRVTPGYIILSVVAFVLTGSLLAACVTGYLPIELTVYAGAVFTAAFVLLVPIVLGALAWLAATALYPFLRVEGRIAATANPPPPRAHHADCRTALYRGQHGHQSGHDHSQLRRGYSHLASQDVHGRLHHSFHDPRLGHGHDASHAGVVRPRAAGHRGRRHRRQHLSCRCLDAHERFPVGQAARESLHSRLHRPGQPGVGPAGR